MDRAKSAVFLGLGGSPAGLVVDDNKLPALVDVEPIDYPSEQHAVEVGLEHQLDTDRPCTVGVLELEILAYESGGIFEEFHRF
jgi:hypothetical protein